MDTKIINWRSSITDPVAYLLDGLGMGNPPMLYWDAWNDRPVAICNPNIAQLLIYMQQLGYVPELAIAVLYEGKAIQISDASAYAQKR